MLLNSPFRVISRNLELLSHRRFMRGIYGVLLMVAFSIFILPLAADEDRPEHKGNVEHSSAHSPSKHDISTEKDQVETNAVYMYRRLFKQKRASHLEAIQKLLQLGSSEKQFKMIKLILTKLVAVLSDARVKLMEAGFTPGDPFPAIETVRDALSIVLENTAFLGEIVLRLPDVTHALLWNNTEWQMTVRWAVEFSKDTKILSGTEDELLSLMAQELGIVEKSPDFINPYREDSKLEKMVDVETEKLLREKIRNAKKKERKEKKKHRGPKLTPAKHNEL